MDGSGALDVTSEEFDAELALRQPVGNVKLPFNIRPLDNISKCRFLLPPKDPNYFSIAKKTTKTNATAAATTTTPTSASNPSTHPSTNSAKPKIPSALDLMTEKFDEGPMALLKGWLQKRERVRVCVRGVKSVRSWCTGEVRAFDKHFNILLGNVVEEFVDPEDNRNEDEGSKTSTKEKSRNYDLPRRRKRRVAQMFIKGDGVVLICSAKPNNVT